MKLRVSGKRAEDVHTVAWPLTFVCGHCTKTLTTYRVMHEKHCLPLLYSRLQSHYTTLNNVNEWYIKVDYKYNHVHVHAVEVAPLWRGSVLRCRICSSTSCLPPNCLSVVIFCHVKLEGENTMKHQKLLLGRVIWFYFRVKLSGFLRDLLSHIARANLRSCT